MVPPTAFVGGRTRVFPFPSRAPLPQGVIASGLLRSWPILTAADAAFLGALAALSGGTLVWRLRWSAGYTRWREVPAVAMRVAVAASPTAWRITQQALNGAPPYSASSALWNAAAFGLLIVFCSFAATGSVMVSGASATGRGPLAEARQHLSRHAGL